MDDRLDYWEGSGTQINTTSTGPFKELDFVKTDADIASGRPTTSPRHALDTRSLRLAVLEQGRTIPGRDFRKQGPEMVVECQSLEDTRANAGKVIRQSGRGEWQLSEGGIATACSGGTENAD